MDTKQLTVLGANGDLGHHRSIVAKLYFDYLAYADRQKKNHLLWFFMALMFQGVFFLASPAILIGFFNAPILVLAVTIINFFANLVANMGGAGIRTTLTLFYIGLFVNILMILIYAF
jgi:hypothetical protein